MIAALVAGGCGGGTEHRAKADYEASEHFQARCEAQRGHVFLSYSRTHGSETSTGEVCVEREHAVEQLEHRQACGVGERVGRVDVATHRFSCVRDG